MLDLTTLLQRKQHKEKACLTPQIKQEPLLIDFFSFYLNESYKKQHEHVNSFSQVTFQLRLLMILNLFYQPNFTSSQV